MKHRRRCRLAGFLISTAVHVGIVAAVVLSLESAETGGGAAGDKAVDLRLAMFDGGASTRVGSEPPAESATEPAPAAPRQEQTPPAQEPQPTPEPVSTPEPEPEPPSKSAPRPEPKPAPKPVPKAAP
ncbi:MAG: hypothetical protein PVF91_13885, partial [Chromatiales bacterium]